MNNFAIRLFKKGQQCTLCTVYLDDAKCSETEKFFERFSESHNEELGQIAQKLDYILNHGANEQLFRNEANAHAIPKNEDNLIRELAIDFSDFPLRLFCLRLSDQLVILFNGGIKDAETAQDSSCSIQFYEALGYTKVIDQRLFSRELSLFSLVDLEPNNEL